MANVETRGPLRAAVVRWQPFPSAFAETVVCKVTFALKPGESVLSPEPDDLHEAESHWSDDATRSVYAPCDLYPLKRRADVLLVGSAFSPGRQPVRSLVARLAVGEVDKAITVHADRVVRPDGEVAVRSLFARLPLRYERAAGGPNTSNPAGMSRAAPPDALGMRILPNLEPTGRFRSDPAEWPETVGFGPIAVSWPLRQRCLGRWADHWPPARWIDIALPPEIDPAWFNAAPTDQQLSRIDGTETLRLENLHAEHATLTTRLPDATPAVTAIRGSGASGRVEMLLDTLWIETDRGVFTVTWRGQTLLARADEQVRYFVELAARRASGGRAAVPATQAADAGSTLFWSEAPVGGAVGPFQPAPAGVNPYAQPAPRLAPPSHDATNVETLDDADVREDTSTITLFGVLTAAAKTMPFMSPSPSRDGAATAVLSAPPPVAPPPRAPMWAATAPPPVLAAQVPPPAVIASSPATPSPWAGGITSSGYAHDGPPPPELVRIQKSADLAEAAILGVAAASDAAAHANELRLAEESAERAAPVREEPRRRPTEALKLLWVEAKMISRMRQHQEWQILLAEMDLRLLEARGRLRDEDEDDAAHDRRAVFEILSRGTPMMVDEIRRRLSEAIDDEGRFEPPLALIAGDLELPFDEVQHLQAAVTVASPLSSSDEKLKTLLTVAQEMLKTPILVTPATTPDLLVKIFSSITVKKGAPPVDVLESSIERHLLLRRAYQFRTVFGRRWIRALLREGKGAGAVVYVPDTLKDELPLFRRFRVRFIGELDLQEDQFEGAGAAVKVAALGRVIPTGLS